MGYILPITHYQYINYEYRMRKSNKSPHYVEKPLKIELGKETKSFSRAGKEKPMNDHFKRTVYVTNNEKSQLTKKGSYVNVTA